jgi:DNA-binding transcriptional regulator YbjK
MDTLTAVVRTRKPSPEERRHLLCDAAIELLADSGAKGLSHLKVDRRARMPDGTTSVYFRTRSALLYAVAERVAQRDAVNFSSVFGEPQATDGAPAGSLLSRLAETVIRGGEEPHLALSRARYELAMEANRDPGLRAIFSDVVAGFTGVSEQAVAQLEPEGSQPEPALIQKQAAAVATFINGVLVRQMLGDRFVEDARELERYLHAIVAGVASEHALTQTHH